MGISVIGGSTGAAPSKIQKTEYITSTQVWTAPVDVTEVEVTLAGGGGGGGGTASTAHGGAGGGGGSVLKRTVSVVAPADAFGDGMPPGSSFIVLIGAGGAGSTDGGASQFTFAEFDPFMGQYVSIQSLLSIGGGKRGEASGSPDGSLGGQGVGNGGCGGAGSSTVSGVVSLNGGSGSFGYGGGGGGGGRGNRPGGVGSNGGGRGSIGSGTATVGNANTGSGGGGSGNGEAAKAGGSGICIIKYWSAL